MPQYTWECEKCGASRTEICTVAEKPAEVKCKKCKIPMEWVPQSNARHFKGRGWTPRFGPENAG